MNNLPPIGFQRPTAASGDPANWAPPGSRATLNQASESYLPGSAPVQPPAPAPEEKKRGVSRPVLLTAGFLGAVTLAAVLSGPLGVGGGGHHGAAPPAADTVVVANPTDNEPACLKTELQKARSGVGLEQVCLGTNLTVRDFGPSKAELRHEKFSTEANGHTLSYDGYRVIAKGGYAPLTVYDASHANQEIFKSFEQEAEGNWSVTSKVSPAGGVHGLISVAVHNEIETGGASPNQEAFLATYDNVEGNRVNLTDLLTPQQFDDVVGRIQKELSARPAGTLFDHGDKLAGIVNSSFSVHQDAAGQVRVTVAVPGSTEANEGQVAEFTFQVPASILDNVLQ